MEEIVKIVKEVDSEGMDWNQLAEDRVDLRANESCYQ
jgi:hypothetical protein